MKVNFVAAWTFHAADDERRTTAKAKESHFVADMLSVNFNAQTRNEKHSATTLRALQAVVNAILATLVDESLVVVTKRFC